MSYLRRILFAIPLFVAVLATHASAGEDENEPPYWASIRAEELNMRVGPSEYYRIAWVYRREGLPLKVIRKKEGWRLVQDPDGAQGWVVARFLSRDRSAFVKKGDLAAMHELGSADSRLLWKVEPGVSGHLGKCADGWCQFDVGGHKGWIREDRLWGVGEP